MLITKKPGTQGSRLQAAEDIPAAVFIVPYEYGADR
jgi:hypothetical protein